MENFIEIIAYVGIVVIYLISRLLQGKKQSSDNTSRPQEGGENTERKKPTTPFEEFLQELRGEEETQEQKKQQEEEPVDHPFAEKRKPYQETSEQKAEPYKEPDRPAPKAETEYRKPLKGTLEESLGELNRDEVQETEKSGAYKRRKMKKGGKKSYNKASVYREMLKDQESARKAIVLSEILKPKHF